MRSSFVSTARSSSGIRVFFSSAADRRSVCRVSLAAQGGEFRLGGRQVFLRLAELLLATVEPLG